jgi:hypothetical protein
MDATQAGILIGSVSGAVGALGGGLCTWGVNAYLKIKADAREDVRLADQREDVEGEREDTTLRYMLGIQQGEIGSLRAEIKEKDANYRAELKTIYDKHAECEKRTAELSTELRVRMELLNARMVSVEQHVEPKVVLEVHESEAIKEAVAETKSAIRQGVHDIKDTLHTTALQQLEAQRKPQS